MLQSCVWCSRLCTTDQFSQRMCLVVGKYFPQYRHDPTLTSHGRHMQLRGRAAPPSSFLHVLGESHMVFSPVLFTVKHWKEFVSFKITFDLSDLLWLTSAISRSYWLYLPRTKVNVTLAKSGRLLCACLNASSDYAELW